MSEVEEGEWSFQKPKKNKKNLNKINNQNNNINNRQQKKKKKNQQDNSILYEVLGTKEKKKREELIQEIETICLTLQSSSYFKNILVNFSKKNINIEENVDKNSSQNEIVSIISLGIGSPYHSSSSLWQFSLLILLKKFLNTSHLFYYDPLMDQDDEDLCSFFNLNFFDQETKKRLEKKNEEKENNEDNKERYFLFPNLFTNQFIFPLSSTPSKLASNQYVLFYMPHCPYKLYCNVLWTFWPSLSNLLIFGNSFENYSITRGLKQKKKVRMKKLGSEEYIEIDEGESDLVEKIQEENQLNKLNKEKKLETEQDSIYEEFKIWNFFFSSSKEKQKKNEDAAFFDRLEPAFCDLK